MGYGKEMVKQQIPIMWIIIFIVGVILLGPQLGIMSIFQENIEPIKSDFVIKIDSLGDLGGVEGSMV